MKGPPDFSKKGPPDFSKVEKSDNARLESHEDGSTSIDVTEAVVAGKKALDLLKRGAQRGLDEGKKAADAAREKMDALAAKRAKAKEASLPSVFQEPVAAPPTPKPPVLAKEASAPPVFQEPVASPIARTPPILAIEDPAQEPRAPMVIPRWVWPVGVGLVLIVAGGVWYANREVVAIVPAPAAVVAVPVKHPPVKAPIVAPAAPIDSMPPASAPIAPVVPQPLVIEPQVVEPPPAAPIVVAPATTTVPAPVVKKVAPPVPTSQNDEDLKQAEKDMDAFFKRK